MGVPQTMIDLDHLPYLGILLAGVALALALGAYLLVRCRSRSPLERLGLMLLPMVALLTCSQAILRIAISPDQDWNAARLAPAVSLWYGFKLYVGRYGPGAILHAIDPPLSYLFYAVAGLVPRPTYAIMTGSFLSFALYLAPALVLGFWRREDEAGGRSPLVGVVTILAFCQAALTWMPLSIAAFSIGPLAAMLSFSGFACLALVLGRRGGANLPVGACLVSSLCVSMAVCSKLSAIPLVVVLPIWVLATRGFRQGVRYSLCMVLALASSILVFRTLFGVSSFAFNLIELPRMHPMMIQGPGLSRGRLFVSAELFCCTIGLFASILLALLARWTFTPSGGERPAGMRRRLVENPWLLFVFAAIAATPMSYRSRIEFGGFVNDYAMVCYFLALGLMAMLLDWQSMNRGRGLEPSNAAMNLAILLLTLSPATVSEDYFQVVNTIHRPSKNVQEIAYQYSKRHPGTAYFPWNPLSTLLGEGKPYHFEFGLVDRETAGFAATQRHFRRNLPDHLHYVCFPPHNRGFGDVFEKTMKYLPEFSRRVEVQGLPGWTCYARDPGPLARNGDN